MTWDAVVVGSGPNGLAAAVALAQEGAAVLVLEAASTPGGATRTEELTLRGFRHDHCSAVHPMGVLSPFFRSLPLGEHGLVWRSGAYSFAHPLDDQPAVLVSRSVEETAARLGVDDAAYRRVLRPYLGKPHAFMKDALAPLGMPSNPLRLARFGLIGLQGAVGFGERTFEGEAARALLAGCAAHSILPLERRLTAALGLMFAITSHIEDWPVAEGGSAAITGALESLLRSLGGEVRCGVEVKTLADLPPARAYLFDTTPRALARICEPVLPPSYRAALAKFRYGPGVFKVDWALDGPIPWRDREVGKASTVHVGGTMAQVAAAERAPWEGRLAERPFVMVCQQSALDPTRAPAGKHTGYGYIHVPPGWEGDATDAIEAQIERFAPGFRDRILAKSTITTAGFEASNANLIGGAIGGGVADLKQAFLRPVARVNPYTTPHPRIFLCSGSTPPGGGVHGMAGYHAARAARRRLSAPVLALGHREVGSGTDD